LFAILRNVYLQQLRVERRQRDVPLELVDLEVARDEETNADEIEPHQLQEALNELPEVFRTPLILFYFEELSYRDIADQMNIPIGTVMSRLARAKSFLRKRLTRTPRPDDELCR